MVCSFVSLDLVFAAMLILFLCLCALVWVLLVGCGVLGGAGVFAILCCSFRLCFACFVLAV